MLAHLARLVLRNDDQPMTAACNVVQRKRSHSVDDHDVDTAVFVRLHKGALQVRLPVVERTLKEPGPASHDGSVFGASGL